MYCAIICWGDGVGAVADVGIATISRSLRSWRCALQLHCTALHSGTHEQHNCVSALCTVIRITDLYTENNFDSVRALNLG
jgi:hypothetical protein